MFLTQKLKILKGGGPGVTGDLNQSFSGAKIIKKKKKMRTLPLPSMNLIKAQIPIAMYLLPFFVFGNGPAKSIWIRQNILGVTGIGRRGVRSAELNTLFL